MSFLKTVDAARARRLKNATPCDGRDIATPTADPNRDSVAMSQVSQQMVASCEAEAQLWRTFYEERAAIREYDGGLSRPEAEAGALQDAITHWLVCNPLSPGVPEDGCLHCAGALAEDYRVAVLAGAGHAWLHPACVQAMNRARLALAECEVRRLLGLS